MKPKKPKNDPIEFYWSLSLSHSFLQIVLVDSKEFYKLLGHWPCSYNVRRRISESNHFFSWRTPHFEVLLTIFFLFFFCIHSTRIRNMYKYIVYKMKLFSFFGLENQCCTHTNTQFRTFASDGAGAGASGGCCGCWWLYDLDDSDGLLPIYECVWANVQACVRVRYIPLGLAIWHSKSKWNG